jgi:hypothetical protein
MQTDPHPYVFAISALASLGALISTLEWIHGYRELRDDGLFSWRIIGTRNIALGPFPLWVLLDRALSFRPFIAALLLRCVVLILFPLTVWLHKSPVAPLVLIVLTSLLMHLRSPWGMDGSDQMFTQVFVALLIGHIPGTALALTASLWYIAAQSCLSYLTAGIAKAISPQWNGTDVVFAIFNTRTYGFQPMARLLLNSPAISRALTWAAVFMECSFPLALVAGYPGCLVFVAWGIGFHLMNAAVMGLNSFLWSFVATYPAVIYCAIKISGLYTTGGNDWLSLCIAILFVVVGLCARWVYDYFKLPGKEIQRQN